MKTYHIEAGFEAVTGFDVQAENEDEACELAEEKIKEMETPEFTITSIWQEDVQDLGDQS